MADRVAGDQTDNAVGRTSAYCATPTTNGCGCPVRYFCCASVSLSFPFALGRTLFSRTAVLFCLPHLRGGTTPLTKSSFHFILFCHFISSVVSVPFVFLSVNASGLLAFVYRTCRTQYDGTSFRCLVCLLHY